MSEARCTTCRSARSQLHRHGGGLSYEMIAAIVLTVMAIALLLQR